MWERIKFRGRGPRRHGGYLYQSFLPLRYAERIAIYIYIITEEDRAIERAQNRADRRFRREIVEQTRQRQERNRPRNKVKLAQKKEIKKCGLALFCEEQYK